MMWNGGFSPEAMWGPPGEPAWARNDPTVNVARLVANNTRIWIYCGNGTPTNIAPSSSDAPVQGLGFLEGFAINSNRAFRDAIHCRRRQQRSVRLSQRHAQLGLLGSAAPADET